MYVYNAFYFSRQHSLLRVGTQRKTIIIVRYFIFQYNYMKNI